VVSPSHLRFEVCRPEIIDETIDGEVVAINLDSGIYYSFRGVAAAIWAGVNGRATPTEIAAAIEAGPGALDDGAQVVARFVEQLVEEGLARPSEADNAADWTVDGLVVDLGAPVLEKFSDLEDLLLLDPIHDVDAEGWPHIIPGS
jgi:hypothetical protein